MRSTAAPHVGALLAEAGSDGAMRTANDRPYKGLPSSRAYVARQASPAPFANLCPRGPRWLDPTPPGVARGVGPAPSRVVTGVTDVLIERHRLTCAEDIAGPERRTTPPAQPPPATKLAPALASSAAHVAQGSGVGVGVGEAVGVGLGISLGLGLGGPGPRAPTLTERPQLPSIPDVLGTAAADRQQVRRLAEAGQRQAVHHCLVHRAAYVRALDFRAGCLELAALDALLRAAEHAGRRRVDHEWRLDAGDPSRRVRRTATALEVTWSQQGATGRCDQATFDAERAECFRLGLTPGRDLPLRPWHDFGWGTAVPMLVLMSLLRRGHAAEAEALLAAGCYLPRLVTESWRVAGPMAEGNDSWRLAQSPLAACLTAPHPKPSLTLAFMRQMDGEHASPRRRLVRRTHGA